QHVAELRLNPLSISARDRLVELAQLLVDLLARASRIRPVETDPAGAPAELHGTRQRRQPGRHAVEDALARALLLPLQRLPRLGVRRPIAVGAGEHVRMAANHLLADAAGDVSESESALLLRDARMERDLEQQVAELVLERREIVALDRVRD